jgi:mono/diheme cytochrome c family protein
MDRRSRCTEDHAKRIEKGDFMTIRFLRNASMAAAALGQTATAQPAPKSLEGSLLRHNFALMYGIPEQYASLRNPLPDSERTWLRGGIVYSQRCASCHGSMGQGDGPGGRLLAPPPANLAWFATLPMSRWDGFMYWTIVEGGQPFATAMPAYKKTLRDGDIWAVTAYIRHSLRNDRPS